MWKRVLDLGGLKRWFGDLRFLEPDGAADKRPSTPRPIPVLAQQEAGAEGIPDATWHPARLALVERLWGDGFIAPGGAADVLQLVNPMGLTGADTLLLLGAGPFGAARAIAGGFHCWVEGYERDATLLAVAQSRAEQAGLKKRAPTQLLNSASKFRAKSASHAVSLQSIGDADAVGPVLAGVAGAMRPGGQLGMVELVVDGDLEDAIGKRWLELEQRSAPPPAQASIGGELRHLSFDVRIVDDISSRHVQSVLTGWMGFLQGVKAERPSRAQAQLMVAEAESWLLRLKLIDAKRLRVMRWQAIRG